jgi:hypothetical protein
VWIWRQGESLPSVMGFLLISCVSRTEDLSHHRRVSNLSSGMQPLDKRLIQGRILSYHSPQETVADTTSDDTNSFVLLVDLWDDTGTHEVSLVRHSNSSPAISISAATTAPYPPPAERPYLGLLDPVQLQAYYASVGDHTTASNLQPYIPAHQRQHQQQQQQQQQQAMMFGGQVPSGYPQRFPGQVQPNYMQASAIPIPIIPTPSQGMFTKNLIGSLCANATRLNDPDGKPGYWFILQDLSVRTEGMFRYVLQYQFLHPHVLIRTTDSS